MRLFFLLVFTGVYFCYGQEPDTIASGLNRKDTPEQKVQWLLKGVDKVWRTDQDYALKLISTAIEVSGGNHYLMARITLSAAPILLKQASYDSMLTLFEKYRPSILELGDSTLLAKYYLESGNLHYYLANDSLCLRNYLSALKIVEATGDKRSQAFVLNNISQLYYITGGIEQSLLYIDKAIELKLAMGETLSIARSYLAKAKILRDLNKNEESLFFYRKALSSTDPITDPNTYSSICNSISITMEALEMYDSALYYQTKAIEIDRRPGAEIALATDLYNHSVTLSGLGRKTEAKRFVVEAMSFAKEIRLLSEMTLFAARLFRELDEDETALDYMEKHIVFRDSLLSEAKMNAIEDLKLQYETEEKVKEIESLKTATELQAAQAQRDRLLLVIIAIALISFMIIASILYRQSMLRKKSNFELNALNTRLKDLNYTKDRLFSIISHDLKSPLSSFYAMTSAMSRNWEKIHPEQAKEFIDSMRDSSQQIQEMLDNLLKWALSQTDQLTYRPSVLDPVPVAEEVLSQLQGPLKLQEIKVNTVIESKVAITADPDYLRVILRNLVSNAIKFSPRSEVIGIKFHSKDKDVVIEIKDNGIGMTSEQQEMLFDSPQKASEIQNSNKKGTGLGLSISYELVKRMGGDLWVQSEPLKGTTFFLKFSQAA